MRLILASLLLVCVAVPATADNPKPDFNKLRQNYEDLKRAERELKRMEEMRAEQEREDLWALLRLLLFGVFLVTAIVAGLAKKHQQSKRYAAAPAPPKPKLIHMTCECGREIRLKPEKAGRLILCPDCRQKLRVPASQGSTPEGPPIVVACSCGREMRLRPHTAGRTVTCPDCKERVPVPVGGAAPDSAKNEPELDQFLQSLDDPKQS